MSFELPRAARALRFSGELHDPSTPADGALGVARVPLARPRPLTAARVAAFGVDDDEQPTRVHPSALAPAANRNLEANPRPVPSFRPAPPVPLARAQAGAAGSAKERRHRAAPKVQAGHACLRSTPRGLSAFAWVCLAVIGAAVSFHAAPPLASRLGLVAAR
jgi:hypothetical protein